MTKANRQKSYSQSEQALVLFIGLALVTIGIGVMFAFNPAVLRNPLRIFLFPLSLVAAKYIAFI